MEQKEINQTTIHHQDDEAEADVHHEVSPQEQETKSPEEAPQTKETNEAKVRNELLLLEEDTPGADRLTRWLAQRPPTTREDDSNRSYSPFSVSSMDNSHKIVEEFMGVDIKYRDQIRKRIKGKSSEHHDTRQYTTPDSPLWHHTEHKLDLHKQQRNVALIGFLLKMAIACAMSMIGFVIAQSSEGMLQWKIDIATQYLTSGDPLTSFAFWLSVNLALGLLATLPVLYWKPMSAGSGIAEAKAVLNGIQLKGCTELTTAFCKAFSVICAGAASLPVGLEGPMIFIGLALGDNVVNGVLDWFTKLLGRIMSSPPTSLLAAKEVYRMDKHKRDLQAVGTACGVTSAFASPIGGVLFAMEEGCSYWSYDLTFRCFSAACVTAFFTYIWLNLLAIARGEQEIGGYLSDGVVSKFSGIPTHKLFHMQSADTIFTVWISFRMVDYFSFAAMGIVGGMLGACWCEANRYMAIARAKWHAHSTSNASKCIEVLFLVTISSTILWWLPQIYRACSKPPSSAVMEEYHRAGCPAGQFNQLATLFWNPTATVGINSLFWGSADAFSAGVCVVGGTVILILLLLLFGSSIGMGIFIPLLFVGGCYGRAFGMAVGPELVTTYAMVGSVAMLAGVTRVFISLCVIMIVATGQPHLITPFMVATLFARATGKAMFGREGIYDIILELKRIPFLEELPSRQIMYRGQKAMDLMSPLSATLEPEEPLGNLLECLKKSNSLHDIPVIDPQKGGVLVGAIRRSFLLTILNQHKLFYEKGQNCYKALNFESLKDNADTSQQAMESLEGMFSEADLQLIVDLTPYIRITPDTLNLNASAERAHTIFRTLGLGNLVVTDLGGNPVGVITRDDLYRLEVDEEMGCQEVQHCAQTHVNQPLTERFSFVS